MADPEAQEEPPKGSRCKCTPRRMTIYSCCCCCCVLVTWFVLVLAVAFVAKGVIGGLSNPWGHQAYHSDNSLIDMHDVLTYEWWPGCEGTAGSSLTAGPNFTNCGSSCCKCAMVPSFRTFNTQANYSHITFPSRPGPDGQEAIQLTGWWLPAGPPGGPVVVLQHGMGGTVNSARPQMAAWLLRTAGFSVVLPNLRNHGTGGKVSHDSQSWGFDYPYDLLGAWDYVVNDPNGVFGGPRNANQVGIMGFSMGGFVAATVFGMEHAVPGLWLDGAITDPKELLMDTIGGYMSFLAPLIVLPAWGIASSMMPVDLRLNLPEKTLPTGPSTERPVMVIHSNDDTSVVTSMAEEMVVLFSGGNRYKVTADFSMTGKCGNNDHNMLFWTEPTAYQRKLCDFWSGVFFGTNCTTPRLVF
uniref:AB hydrolase-1 domain-containing protein n=1 Tax=Alexandrium catenella TaxID=2925 RepID=A0A7S1RJG1_ALECA